VETGIPPHKGEESGLDHLPDPPKTAAPLPPDTEIIKGQGNADERPPLIATSLFDLAQAQLAYQPAPSALAAIPTTSQNAQRAPSGMDQILDARGTNKIGSSTQRASSSAPTGNDLQVAPRRATTIDTNAQVAEKRRTALRVALEHRKGQALTPLRWREWSRLLSATGLLCKYPHIPTSL
jgi:hypothetical protein